jgi:hypothetical protein
MIGIRQSSPIAAKKKRISEDLRGLADKYLLYSAVSRNLAL